MMPLFAVLWICCSFSAAGSGRVPPVEASTLGSTSELAERLRVTKGAISQMLKRLEQKGLLAREAVGRRVSLEPTALGWRAHRAHQDFHLRQAEVLGAQYSDPATLQRDREALERLLAGVRAFGAQDQS